jgi:hypothetical protein
MAHSASPVISLLSPVHPSSVAYRMFPIYAAPVITYFGMLTPLFPLVFFDLLLDARMGGVGLSLVH